MNETFKESGVTLEYGIITQVDEYKYKVKARIPDLEDMETHWLPVMAGVTFGDQHYHLPEVETQVVILLDARGENGLVIGAIYSEADPPPIQDKNKFHKRFSDGTIIEYDKTLKKLTVDVQGVLPLQSFIEIKSNNLITVQADMGIILQAPITTINGNLKVNGSIS